MKMKNEWKFQSKNILNMKMVVNYLNFVFYIEVKTKSKYKILNFVFQFFKNTKWHFGYTDSDETEDEKFWRRLFEKTKIGAIRLHIKIDYENKEEKKLSDDSSVKVKFPKLVISKFEGTALDWFPFWNLFESELDKQDISPVTKFSYLKELLFPQVRKLIDSFLFTSEEYSRAKPVLLAKFGKPTVVDNAHVKYITPFSVLSGIHPSCIHDFF